MTLLRALHWATVAAYAIVPTMIGLCLFRLWMLRDARTHATIAFIRDNIPLLSVTGTVTAGFIYSCMAYHAGVGAAVGHEADLALTAAMASVSDVAALVWLIFGARFWITTGPAGAYGPASLSAAVVEGSLERTRRRLRAQDDTVDALRANNARLQERYSREAQIVKASHTAIDAEDDVGEAILLHVRHDDEDEFIYVSINEILAMLNGLDAKSHIGRSVRDLFGGNLAEVAHPILLEAMKSGRPQEFEFMASTTDPNTPLPWRGTYYPLVWKPRGVTLSIVFAKVKANEPAGT